MSEMSQYVIPHKVDIPDGAMGVWQIPELVISIPLYQGNNATAQALIDAEQSACIERFGVGRIINDHADSKTMESGRWQVWRFFPDVVAFLITSKDTTKYTCTSVCKATRHTHSYIADGQSIYPRSSAEILCASCASLDGREVYLARFKYDGKMPR